MQLDPIKDLAEDLWVMGALFLAFSDAGASIRPIVGVCVLPPHPDRGRSLGLRAGHRNSRCHNPAEPRGPPQRSTLKSRLRPAQIRERCDAFELGRTTAPCSTKCPTQCSSVQYGTPVIRWEEGCAAGGRRLAARLREVAQPGRAPVRWNDATCLSGDAMCRLCHRNMPEVTGSNPVLSLFRSIYERGNYRSTRALARPGLFRRK